MKRFSRHAGVIFAMFLFFPLSAFAGWVLYDDFSSGQIDITKWEVAGQDAATVSVEDGAAKFVLDTDIKNKSSWLKIKQSPEKVKGIRVKVKFESRVVGVRGRIAGYVGTDPNGDHVWTQIALQQSTNDPLTGNQFAWYGMSTIDPENNYIDVKSYLYGEFPRPLAGTYPAPIDLTGEWVTLEISFNPAKFTYGLPDPDLNWYLKNYKPLTKVKKYGKDTDPDFLFKGIGVRANSGAPDGQQCVIYFDDVYVLR